ncbi:MAG: phosphatase PAP2 family protein [Giesbergeria sp.]
MAHFKAALLQGRRAGEGWFCWILTALPLCSMGRRIPGSMYAVRDADDRVTLPLARHRYFPSSNVRMSSDFNANSTVDWRSILFFDFWFKFIGTSVFMSIFFWAYFSLLKDPAFPVVVMPLTVVDDWVDFSPIALVPYFSLWIYCSLPVMAMPQRVRLINFGLWIGAMSLIALSVFYFLPSAVPSANIDWTQYPSVSFLKEVDAAGNACPSMHVAAAIYSSFWLYWLMSELRMGWRAQAVQVFWGLAIVYSTMATKQHVSLDVWAGIALGTVFAWVSRKTDLKLRPAG